MSAISGRVFEPTDNADSPPVMIVNEAWATQFLPQEDPIGRRVFSSFDPAMGGPEVGRAIAGAHDLSAVHPRHAALWCDRLRVQVAPRAVIGEVRERLSAIRADVPAVDFETLDERLQTSLRELRFYVFLAAICAALAVLFAGEGSTASWLIRYQHVPSPARIVGLVLWQGAVMALLGGALGLLLAFVSMRGLASLLFDVDPLDPPTLAASVAFVIGVALVAAFVPAWRACRLGPMTALRHEE